MKFRILIALAILSLLAGCGQKENDLKDKVVAFTGANLIDGSGKDIIKDAILLVYNGKVQAVGNRSTLPIPENAIVMDVEGKTIMPGIINAHGHIGGTNGLKAAYSKENVIRDLKLNAAYGVTTVYSLGGDGEASIAFRDEQDTVALDRSRIFVAGEVITGNTPEEARAMVDKNAAMKVDFIKIRVDNNLGATEKMKPEIYEAVIDQAKKHNLAVMAHIFYLEDAKALLRLGVRFIAHSVRDQKVDAEFITMMKQYNATYCPTLMREVSTFVYESTPDFFQDPFFLSHADTALIKLLKDPLLQRSVKENINTSIYKGALILAKLNLKLLSDAGVKIAFGTDSGPPTRFQGYFEHLELEQMVAAGLTPMQAIVSASRDAVYDNQKLKLGTLEAGKQADFIILTDNPLVDIKNTRSIEQVWIGGNKLPLTPRAPDRNL